MDGLLGLDSREREEVSWGPTRTQLAWSSVLDPGFSL